MNYLLITGLVILFVSNLAFAILYFREKRKKPKEKTGSSELSEFLQDLLQGEGLIRITRVAPTDVFLRSPRHGRN